MAADRHPRACGSTPSVHRPVTEPSAQARGAFDDIWGTLSSHYATGIEHINGALARQADASRLGGRFSSI